MNRYNNFISKITSKGLLCSEYIEKLKIACSKHAIFNILCDCNGVSFFHELEKDGIDVPYNDVESFFAKYINGQCICKYNGYTSTMMVNYNGEYTAETTLISVVNSKCTITIPSNSYVTIYVNKSSNVDVFLEHDARANVCLYGNGIVGIGGDVKNCTLRTK